LGIAGIKAHGFLCASNEPIYSGKYQGIAVPCASEYFENRRRKAWVKRREKLRELIGRYFRTDINKHPNRMAEFAMLRLAGESNVDWLMFNIAPIRQVERIEGSITVFGIRAGNQHRVVWRGYYGPSDKKDIQILQWTAVDKWDKWFETAIEVDKNGKPL
jgi:hypothetical protein